MKGKNLEIFASNADRRRPSTPAYHGEVRCSGCWGCRPSWRRERGAICGVSRRPSQACPVSWRKAIIVIFGRFWCVVEPWWLDGRTLRMARSEIAVTDEGIRYVYFLGSRSRRAFGYDRSGLLLMLCFIGCAIYRGFSRGRNVSVMAFLIRDTAAAVCLIAARLVAEDEVVASQIECAVFGLAPSVQADIFESQFLLRVSRRICHNVGEFIRSSAECWVSEWPKRQCSVMAEEFHRQR